MRSFTPLRHAALVAAALVLCSCRAVVPAVGAPAAAVPPAATPPAGVSAQMLDQVNAARIQGRTCGTFGAFAPTHPLRFEARLTAAAQDHAEDMNARYTMSHTGGDGSNVGQRVERLGYDFATVGENVAFGYPSVEEVTDGWLGSDGHCANLMDPGFTEFGGGEAGGFWAQVFGRQR